MPERIACVNSRRAGPIRAAAGCLGCLGGPGPRFFKFSCLRCAGVYGKVVANFPLRRILKHEREISGWLAAAGCALFAVSASAANTPIADTFEAGVDSWTGNATQSAKTYTYNNTVGTPLSGTHAHVLAVEGKASRAASTTANKPATVDMMVQIALPDEPLTALPSSVSDQGNIQIAVGVTTTDNENQGALKVYCSPKSGAAGWFLLGDATYGKDSWHRVSFTFDYAARLCQIRVDGEPVMSANGYLTTDTTKLPETAGSWYRLATASSTALASVDVVGCTAIDDVVVKDGETVSAVLPTLADATTTRTSSGVQVSNSWIEEQGITRAQADGTTMPDGTAMTIGQKYAAGYTATDGKTFGVKAMKMAGTNARFEFDTAVMGRGYKYVLQTSADGSTWTDTDLAAAEVSAGYKEVALGTGAVKYYRLKVVTAQ